VRAQRKSKSERVAVWQRKGGPCSFLVFVFIQLSFSFLRRDGGVVYVIRLLFACGMSFSFFARLRSFVYTGAKRKGERGRGRGFLDVVYLRDGTDALSPRLLLLVVFNWWGKRKVFQMSDGRDAETKRPEPSFLPPCLCISSFLVLSGWVRRGKDDGVTHCPLG